jgi:UDP-glucose-4-epimerase GalE
LKRDRVLVTGGAGFVGSAVARRLAAAGREVVVLDDLSAGHRSFVRWGPLVVGDVGDADTVRRVLREHRATSIVHLAAKALVGESVAKPGLYDAWNRGKTEVLARTAAEEGVRAIVFSSTCAVYGEPVEVPIPESHPRAPVNPYGASKAAAEDALFASGVPTAALRYFNAAGALPDDGVGERHEPETHLLPIAIRAALDGGTVTVYGADWPTPDGTCVRDYVHVADLADAHEIALRLLEDGAAGGAWNLGTGEGASVLEVLAAVERGTGRAVRRVVGPRREGDPPRLVARADRARADLGWRPRRSDLDTLVRDAARFLAGGDSG